MEKVKKINKALDFFREAHDEATLRFLPRFQNLSVLFLKNPAPFAENLIF